MEDSSHIRQFQEDHDLLIEIRTQMKIILEELKSLHNNFDNKISLLQETKLEKMEAYRLLAESNKWKDEYKKKLEQVRNWMYIAIGAFAAVEFYFKFFR